MTDMNVREKMEAIAAWLGHTDETISFGLRSIADAEKLYDYAGTRDSDEYPDQYTTTEFRRVLGYVPWDEAIKNELRQLAEDEASERIGFGGVGEG